MDDRPAADPTDTDPTDTDPTDTDPTDTDPTDDDQSEQPELGAPGIPACDLLDLPATALPVIEDIEAGGPYDYPRNDGVHFQNREGILPDEDRDFYREFTVETPGLDHRGPRRIVTGGFEETDPEHWYFTEDHYESFCEFDPDRAEVG
ncbi:ribonuclease [Ornithinimicrobium ciconiae]|uniref:Ribonuclease n=1 Tax=Ornithinimicrobium ciconiae TaxID=2594265 RepID=A0A516GF70_9MICO|nr:ribonuclease [Ornithinimicrobium ciconiae]